MKTYSLKQLNSSFVKALIFTIILALIGGLGMFGLAKHKQKTTYTAERYVLITHNMNETQNTINDDNHSMTAEDLNMMPSYEDIVQNDLIAKRARKYLPKKIKKQYSISDISSTIKAKSKPQSLVLKISSRTSNENNSIAIANAVAKGFKDELPKLQPGAGQVHLLAKADKSSVNSETTPNKKKYVVVGVALGGLLGVIISFVIITWKKIINN